MPRHGRRQKNPSGRGVTKSYFAPPTANFRLQTVVCKSGKIGVTALPISVYPKKRARRRCATKTCQASRGVERQNELLQQQTILRLGDALDAAARRDGSRAHRPADRRVIERDEKAQDGGEARQVDKETRRQREQQSSDGDGAASRASWEKHEGFQAASCASWEKDEAFEAASCASWEKHDEFEAASCAPSREHVGGGGNVAGKTQIFAGGRLASRSGRDSTHAPTAAALDGDSVLTIPSVE